MPYLEKLTDTRWGWWVEHAVTAAIVVMLVIAIVA